MRVIIRDGDEITVADTNSIDDPRYIVIGETGGSGKAHTFNVPAVTGSYTYNGANQTPTLSEYYSDFMTLSGEVTEKNAGTYTITVALKDIANCQWSDHSVGDKTLTWSIGKAALPKPSVSPSSIVLSEIQPTATFSVSRAGNGVITVTSSDPEAVSASVSGTTVTVTALDTSEELETSVIVTVGEDTNYNAYTDHDVACAVRIAIPAVDGCVRFHGTNLSFAFSGPKNGTIEYSLNGVEWSTYASGRIYATGNDIFIRGTGNTHWNQYTQGSYPTISLGGTNISIAGKIETLLDYATVLNGGHPTADSYAFAGIFKGQTNIVNAAEFELPSSGISKYEFQQLFYGCTSLVNAPKLPATGLNSFCYYEMFLNCTSLVNAPVLPATILYNSCYIGMFAGCRSLVNAPALPATNTPSSYSLSYERMFAGCTSLVTAPTLPATTNKVFYSNMFNGCTSLVNAPALPATSVKYNGYLSMFEGCTSLVNAPALPATTLDSYCYKRMFYGCTSLVNAPALPATTMYTQCYAHMFDGCTSLVNAPALSATTMASGCYTYMFRGCTALVNAPALPATTLATTCYSCMFDGCVNLETIPLISATYYPSACMDYMYQDCVKIKISETETSEYINAFRLPVSGTGTIDTQTPGPFGYMFNRTGGTFTGTPTVNTTYYTANTVIS